MDVKADTSLSRMGDGEIMSISYDASKEMMGTVVDYMNLMMVYDCAIKLVQTKFDMINTEYRVHHKRNPIHSISSRLKKPVSIMEKLQREDVPIMLENIQGMVHDVAGVRVVCSYLDDVYEVAEMLSGQEDVRLIRRKDYICSPKPNGYRSLHLILSVPVFFEGQNRWMEVEVQLRTIAMDFWASLEHQLKYKKDIADEKQVIERLRVCAETIARTDRDMLQIRRSIEECAGVPTEDELLLEWLRDISISAS